MPTSLYPADFYADRRTHTAHAAARIFGCLPRGLKRDRIADIGCGTGTFLAASEAQYRFGMEGDWVRPDMLDDPGIDFCPHNLEHPFTGPLVDLALSLEVAEHLPLSRAESFVADLATMAPAVLFSAAIPGQGGVGHVNEQWPSYWAGLFAAHRLKPYDIIRDQIWTDDAIPAWYRQNVILFLDDQRADSLALTPAPPELLDRVHPAFWARANRELQYANALPESEVLRRQAEAAQQ